MLFRSVSQSRYRANGNITHYALVFYGTLKSLTDKFGEDKLINLTNLNDIINFNYSATNVVNLVVNTNTSNLAFPLISSNKAWQYGGGVDDISTSVGSIEYTELFPAVMVKRIFEAIENKYNVSFVGNFLTDKRFTELFLYAKNSEKFTFKSNVLDLDLTSITGAVPPNFKVDLTNNSVEYYGFSGNDNIIHFTFSVTTSLPDAISKLHIYENGVLSRIVETTGSSTLNIFYYSSPTSDSQRPRVFTFKLEANGVVTASNLGIYLKTQMASINLIYNVTVNTSGLS